MANVKFESYEYRIPQNYLSYLVNGDATGLNDDEYETILNFEENLPGVGHWCLPDDIDEEMSFSGWNDVDKYANDCIDLEYMVRIEAA